MKMIAASIMCADSLHLADELRALEQANVKMLHCDVMDGVFVENAAMGAYVLQDIKNNTKMLLDIHLATVNPDKFVDLYAAIKPAYMSFHVEASRDVNATINHIRELGIRPSIAISPDTEIEQIYPFLDKVDMVLMMTVNPGFAGQKFQHHVLEKIKKLQKELESHTNKPLIEVDGNIFEETVRLLEPIGADVYVVGTAALFNEKAGSYTEKLAPLREIIQER
ncbi:TPA: ribulose-phosphate 3-epimerase [Listeria monocytogenes]|uniref:ribulose-phosphate 3-epimerase n=1 Tax=Listeria monocytogenes TaxID=1639 RepID=A0A470RIP5_LISMN|nr:ribulose-phosphate 3-epimerase [Listeria monocytogenes]EAA0164404.1 ribulose-phosphate 3-epimerase [Listeria monocytogenes serotype 1/2a]EAF4521379.1 ribulose-phosphate 3-epimerase [Listeria monocytogenes serotype 4b]EAG6289575.1 ribulose-phosphate 3-epimerase [Listeria monocytogenes CFSAN003825]EAG6316829.1 ribulose-phosphate 3-epimerase [Listeria monocytogenes CFSAN003824]EAG6342037.1 ribulose-phosphate 3-epimerase [Listeria monocytogenes CFSAN003811]